MFVLVPRHPDLDPYVDKENREKSNKAECYQCYHDDLQYFVFAVIPFHVLAVFLVRVEIVVVAFVVVFVGLAAGEGLALLFARGVGGFGG